jgi:hypothetical protein
MMLLHVFVFGDANTLYGKQGILRAAIAFFTNAGFFAPQVALNGIALGHFVVTVALREAHAAAVGKLAYEGYHLPLHVGGWALGGIAEEDFVLDLQPPELRVEKIQFLVGGHAGVSSTSLGVARRGGEVSAGH